MTTQSTGGMGGGWFAALLMSFAQSAEDGTMPLLYCMARPEAESGDFYEPPGSGTLGGPATKKALAGNNFGPEARALLWEESERAAGGFSVAPSAST